MLQKLSIDWKLPLSVCAVLMAVVGTLSVLTYREVRRSTQDAAAERVRHFALQLALSLQAQTDRGLLRLTSTASQPPLIEYLRATAATDAQADAARAVLESVRTVMATPETFAALELLTLDRRRPLGLGPGIERVSTIPLNAFLRDGELPRSGGASPLLALDDGIVVAHFAPIVAAEETVGHVVLWSHVGLSSAVRSQISALLAPEAAVRLGTPDGAWTDFERAIAAPPVDFRRAGEVVQIERPQGLQLASVAPVRDTPWFVVVEYPEDLVVEPVRRVAERAGFVAVLLLLAGFGGVWWTARRITRPLRELTVASESLVGGTNDAPAAGADEIVRLRTAFGRMAERVQESQRRLEAKVLELREATSREQTARTAAEDANSRKDEFLAMLAHELRNPLSPILSALTAMRHPRMPDEDRVEALSVIERQVLNMSRMVDDLLDVSRITSGMVARKRRRVDVAELVRHALEIARPLIDAKRHHVSLALPETPLMVDADPARMEQVLANLATNAAKYTQPGGRIWIAAGRESDEIVFRVRDDGMGIAADQLPHVFDLFFQGDRSIHRSSGGLGIGLTLARKLTELHGGSVIASSSGPGRGSEFVVRIPAGAESGPESLPLPAAAAQETPSDRLRILVVDDARDTRELLKLVLELDGHEVKTAEDGNDGLAAFRSFEPNVVILDLGLPGLDGYGAARRIREEASRHVVLIAATGYGDAATHARVREAGFDEHLVKPIQHADLATILANAKNGRSGAATHGEG